MKIVLPKSLAEPLTIPWTKRPKNADLIMHIKRELGDYFAYLEREGIAPEKVRANKTISLAAMCSALRHSAWNNGALEVRSEVWHLPSSTDLTSLVGYRYHVKFTVPGSDGIHTVILDSYFK